MLHTAQYTPLPAPLMSPDYAVTYGREHLSNSSAPWLLGAWLGR